MKTNWLARTFLGLMALAALGALGYSLLHVRCDDPLRFAALLLVALVASILKARLPGTTGTMSVNLPFVLVAAVVVSPFETLMIALGCALMQSVIANQQRTQLAHVMFNCSSIVLSATAVLALLKLNWWPGSSSYQPVLLGISAVGYLLVNTVFLAMIIRLTEGGNIGRIWMSIFLWALPYYVASAGLAAMFTATAKYIGWEVPLLLFPMMFGIHRSYRLFYRSQPVTVQAEPRAKAATTSR